jgi:ribose-phosphate pyrophosphokinase
MQLVGEVKDSIALLVDDMIDTAGTITEAARVVAHAGATEVIAVATHPILSDPACDRLNKSNITEIVTTNTIPLRAKAQAELTKLHGLSVASLLAEAMKRIHNEESVSSLFA